ncbi:hypothetical protein AJ88_05870 [Mesorhizobium amorphae CCBAU 01583]|nr:hypothetical protein AJ88_05870 [Mesorhizobium amorphae CCBAU 01583]
MAGVILVMSLAFVLLRGNIAWRRSRDANGRSWILWAYIVFSAIYAVLQAGTMLVIDFGNPDSVPGGLNLLGFPYSASGYRSWWQSQLAASISTN